MGKPLRSMDDFFHQVYQSFMEEGQDIPCRKGSKKALYGDSFLFVSLAPVDFDAVHALRFMKRHDVGLWIKVYHTFFSKPGKDGRIPLKALYEKGCKTLKGLSFLTSVKKKTQIQVYTLQDKDTFFLCCKVIPEKSDAFLDAPKEIFFWYAFFCAFFLLLREKYGDKLELGKFFYQPATFFATGKELKAIQEISSKKGDLRTSVGFIKALRKKMKEIIEMEEVEKTRDFYLEKVDALSKRASCRGRKDGALVVDEGGHILAEKITMPWHGPCICEGLQHGEACPRQKSAVIQAVMTAMRKSPERDMGDFTLYSKHAPTDTELAIVCHAGIRKLSYLEGQIEIEKWPQMLIK